MAASNTLASRGHIGMMDLGSALLQSTVFSQGLKKKEDLESQHILLGKSLTLTSFLSSFLSCILVLSTRLPGADSPGCPESECLSFSSMNGTLYTPSTHTATPSPSISAHPLLFPVLFHLCSHMASSQMYKLSLS